MAKLLQTFSAQVTKRQFTLHGHTRTAHRSSVYQTSAEERTLPRCEIRCPDGAGNPYLQFAVLLATGLDGIKNKIDPGDPVELNVYHMSYEERKERNIVSLPESLKEALDELETSDLMRETLGETAFENFLIEKRKEWDQYRTQVTEWEVNRYIKRL